MFIKAIARVVSLGGILISGGLAAQDDEIAVHELRNDYSEAEMTCCVSWIWEWVLDARDEGGQWEESFGELVKQYGIMEVRYALFDVVPAVLRQREVLASARMRCDGETGVVAGSGEEWAFVGKWCEENLVEELRWWL